MTEQLPDFVVYSLQPVQPENRQLVLGPVADSVVEQLLDTNGVNLSGYVHMVDIYAIRHIMKSHGNEQKEAMRGQKAVSVSDFEQLTVILSEPDVVFYDGRNKIGRDVFQFHKRIGDLYVVLQEVRTGKRQLALNSMRIIRAKRNQGEP
jgi:hypothetical protein